MLTSYDADLLFFFFNDTATTEIYTLSLHDALPISAPTTGPVPGTRLSTPSGSPASSAASNSRYATSGVSSLGLSTTVHPADRKSTRLNSSHANISYAVFCLKKKKQQFHLST